MSDTQQRTTLEGHWRPGGRDEDSAVPGVLTIEQNGAASLTLFGGFDTAGPTAGPVHSSQRLTEFPLVVGAALDGTPVSLLGVTVTRANRTFTAAMRSIRQVLRAERVLHGVALDSPEAALFTSAQVQIENLQIWSAQGVELEISPGSEQQTCTATAPEPITFSCSSLTHTLSHHMSIFDSKAYTDGIRIDSATHVVLTLESDMPLSHGGFNAALGDWLDLLTFATGEPCAVLSFSLLRPNGEAGNRPRPTTVRAQWISEPRQPAVRTQIENFLFSAHDLPVEDCHQRWVKLREKPRAIDMLLTLTYAPHGYVQNDLLVVAAAVEALHRDLEADLPAKSYTNDKGKPRGPYYHERALQLAEIPDAEAVGHALNNDVGAWATMIKDNRHGLAHGLPKVESDVTELYRLVRRTQLLLQLVLMSMLGVPAERQRDHAFRRRMPSLPA
ncbi:HEPN domain-containing protein [Gordonia malaquae]|uniref:ApeA N-terminal domain 1-containing protein n=1 Tax=Gordonia malaquae TaxID=410332 RepID=UPI0030FE1314